MSVTATELRDDIIAAMVADSRTVLPGVSSGWLALANGFVTFFIANGFGTGGGGGGSVPDGTYGDITVSGSGTVWTIGNSRVTNAKLANMGASTIKGNNSGVSGAPLDLTASQTKALLAIAASDVSGLAAIATSGSGADLSTGSVTNAKLANMNAATLKGNNSGVAGAPLDLTATQAKALLAIAASDVSGLAAIATSGSGADLTSSSVANSKLATMAASTIKGNNGGTLATPSDLTAAQVKTLLAIAAGDVSGLAAIATSGSASDLTAGTLPSGRFPALTGDVTTTAGALTTAIGAHKVTRGMLTQGTATSILGVAGGSTADIADIVASADGAAMMRMSGSLTWQDMPSYVPTIIPYLGVFGDGSDGVVHFDGSSTVLGFAPSSGHYTVTRDIFATNVTIDSGAVVAMSSSDTETSNAGSTQARRLFATGTATINGRLINNGHGGVAHVSTANPGAATNYTSSSPSGGGTGQAASAGGNGVTTGAHVWGAQAATGGGAAGVAGSNATGNYLGGGGGGGGTQAGGSSGATQALSGASLLGVRYAAALIAGVEIGTTSAFSLGGSGGGGGGGDGSNFGGGGGGPGGVTCVVAKVLTGTGSIEAKGADGNTGSISGNTGGGGGGGGGSIIVITTSTTSLPSFIVTGGNGGAGGGTGKAGGNGSAGKVFLFNT